MKTGGMMTIWAGATLPRPLAIELTRLIRSVEVHDIFDGQSGFRIRLGALRETKDYAGLGDSVFNPLSRVQISFGWCLPGVPLINGVVVDRHLRPGGAADAEIVIDGRDLSALMDMKAEVKVYERMTDSQIVDKTLVSYLKYGITPQVTTTTPLRAVSIKRGTDLDQFYSLADRFGYAFAVRPGSEPGLSRAYWGPRKATGSTKPALTAGQAFSNNVEYVRMRQKGLAWEAMSGSVQDPTVDQINQVQASTPSLSPLAANSPASSARRQRLIGPFSGLSDLEARAYAQGQVDMASMDAMTLDGALDVSVYGDFLRAGDKVSVRAAGVTADGAYMVTKVVHKLAPGSYRQEFTLQREGSEPTSPLVKT